MEKLLWYALGLLISWAALIWVRSRRYRQAIWLLLSYALYVTWGGWSLSILLFSSLVNYGLGKFLRRRTSQGRLWMGVAFNVLLLGAFKYLPAFAHSLPAGSALGSLNKTPLGASFWTFQALSYLFDVYRQEELDPSLLEFCLYMAFWPTIISGPICRLPNLLPQFRRNSWPSWEDYAAGARRVCVGFLMLGIAELLASGLAPGQGINAGFARMPARWSGADVWLLLIGYGFQLFFDFAGYSHLVIGAARLFGIELAENFDRPYLASTPSVFWTRWHMSLSFWIRDYVFLPLASASPSLWWRNLSLLIAMILFGLWHKSSILYIVWGAYHGMLLVLHRQWQQLYRRAGLELPSLALTSLGWAATFGSVILGWVFFRAQNMHQAMAMLQAVFSPASYAQHNLPGNLYVLNFALVAGYFVCLGAARLLDRFEEASVVPTRVNAALQLISRERWVWIAPLVAVAALYVFLLAQPSQADASSMLYRLF
jgi:alginate O-acetyltransferase complex protein AlgI